MATIEEIKEHEIWQKVYNFQVEELECYAVGSGGVLVHNTSSGYPSWIWDQGFRPIPGQPGVFIRPDGVILNTNTRNEPGKLPHYDLDLPPGPGRPHGARVKIDQATGKAGVTKQYIKAQHKNPEAGEAKNEAEQARQRRQQRRQNNQRRKPPKC